MNKIEVYTDGAYASSRNQGGWAFVILEDGKKIHKDFGGVKNTTNNRMEIMGCLEAMKWLKENNHKEAIIYCDSMYVIGTMSKGWKRNKNVDLWISMDDVSEKLIISWTHVKGHEGNKYNEQCDTYAVHASHLILEEDE